MHVVRQGRPCPTGLSSKLISLSGVLLATTPLVDLGCETRGFVAKSLTISHILDLRLLRNKGVYLKGGVFEEIPLMVMQISRQITTNCKLSSARIMVIIMSSTPTTRNAPLPMITK